jgi:hypothetical protein
VSNYGGAAKLKSAAESHMPLLEQTPDRVRTYFQDQRTRYAAWKLLNAGAITPIYPFCMCVWPRSQAIQSGRGEK